MDIEKHNQVWQEKHTYTAEMFEVAEQILREVREGAVVEDAIRHNPLPTGGHVGKHVLVAAYQKLTGKGTLAPDPDLLGRIRMKPIRSLSGVTTVTVLTMPYVCPGECIFCPTEERMPKSYLIGEPGAMRGLQNEFDPYLQVTSRIQGLQAVGHPTDKIELLVLGGTWSAYPRRYQEWFIKRCLDGLNGEDSATLEEAQEMNETASHRNVGMVIETRPDAISKRELSHFRRLGVTKVQIGAQSMDDEILQLNKRGHTVKDTLDAVGLLRAAGFKIVIHWMPNLYGSDLERDQEDFAKLWVSLCPDELKIYPNQLLENAELYQYWLRGQFTPYTTEQLVTLIAGIKPTIPRYCRVNRVIRDIPSTLVVEGNKRTSLRQDIQQEMSRRGTSCQCIRCREIRKRSVAIENLSFNDFVYHTEFSEEHFLSFDTIKDKLAGFLRLSLPGSSSPDTGIRELGNAAIIREVHVYGQSLSVGADQAGAAQHIGLGTELISRAEAIAQRKGYSKLAIISAIGTRQYYKNRGFNKVELYMVKKLS